MDHSGDGGIFAVIPYFFGCWLGEERLCRFLGSLTWLALVYESDFGKASGWFERHGGKVVLICRLVPGVGSLISVPAETKRMEIWRFVIYTSLGSGLRNGVFIGLGWLGARCRLAEQYEQAAFYGVLAAIISGGFVVAVAAFEQRQLAWPEASRQTLQNQETLPV